MLTSFTKKFKSFLFQSNGNENSLANDRKRKRPLEEREQNVEFDVQVTTVKKPRLHDETSVFKNLFNSSTIQNMSDWVQKKSPGIFRFESSDISENITAIPTNVQDKDRNGDSHHRFKTVDLSQNYMRGTWPQNGASMNLGNPSVHVNGMRSQSASSSRASSIDGRAPRKKLTPFERLFKTRKRHRFTAGESVRLEEKGRYQQLLKQFTSVPLEKESDKPVEQLRHPICAPKLPSSNQSILGSNISQDIVSIERPQDADRSRMIKVHPNYRSTPLAVRNGHAPDDDLSLVQVTDISAIRQTRVDTSGLKTIVDLTEDDTVIEVRNERTMKTKSTTKDYRESKFLTEDWIKNLTTTYNSKARERERKIAEEEMKAKLFDERRKTQELDLEKRIRRQMQIHAREPAVLDETIDEEVEEEEEEEKEEFIELSPEMEKKIDYCFRGGSAGEILVDKFRLQITRGDIGTLAGLNWLNDEVINFYMNLLMERGEKEGMPKVHAFNTFFYPKVMSGGQSAVKRWTRRVDVLAMDYILVPVHLGMHWCLAVIDFKKKDIQYYDSMGGNNAKCLNALKTYLCDESKDKKKKEFDLSGWRTTIVKDIPQQMNGSDCGMFACKYADYITREASITFTQEHMPYFRRRMVYEIVTGQLLQ